MTDTLDQQWITTPEAAESRVGDEIVILHLKTGTYFGLDPVGALVWRGLKSRLMLRDICAAVANQFDEELGRVEDDVRALLSQLLEHALVALK